MTNRFFYVKFFDADRDLSLLCVYVFSKVAELDASLKFRQSTTEQSHPAKGTAP